MGLLGSSRSRQTLGGVLGQRDRFGQYKTTDMAQRAESAQKAVSETAGRQSHENKKKETKQSDLSTGLQLATAASYLGATGAGVMKALDMKGSKVTADPITGEPTMITPFSAKLQDTADTFDAAGKLQVEQGTIASDAAIGADASGLADTTEVLEDGTGWMAAYDNNFSLFSG
jgi:hypothetical protein